MVSVFLWKILQLREYKICDILVLKAQSVFYFKGGFMPKLSNEKMGKKEHILYPLHSNYLHKKGTQLLV